MVSIRCEAKFKTDDQCQCVESLSHWLCHVITDRLITLYNLQLQRFMIRVQFQSSNDMTFFLMSFILWHQQSRHQHFLFCCCLLRAFLLNQQNQNVFRSTVWRIYMTPHASLSEVSLYWFGHVYFGGGQCRFQQCCKSTWRTWNWYGSCGIRFRFFESMDTRTVSRYGSVHAGARRLDFAVFSVRQAGIRSHWGEHLQVQKWPWPAAFSRLENQGYDSPTHGQSRDELLPRICMCGNEDVLHVSWTLAIVGRTERDKYVQHSGVRRSHVWVRLGGNDGGEAEPSWKTSSAVARAVKKIHVAQAHFRSSPYQHGRLWAGTRWQLVTGWALSVSCSLWVALLRLSLYKRSETTAEPIWNHSKGFGDVKKVNSFSDCKGFGDKCNMDASELEPDDNLWLAGLWVFLAHCGWLSSYKRSETTAEPIWNHSNGFGDVKRVNSCSDCKGFGDKCKGKCFGDCR